MIFRDLIPEEEFTFGDKVRANYTNEAYYLYTNIVRKHIYPFVVDNGTYTKHGVFIDPSDTTTLVFCKRVISNTVRRIYPLKYHNIKHSREYDIS